MVFATLPVSAFSANAETVLHCRHEHDDSCYEKNAVATGSEADKLVCRHEHDETCYEDVVEGKDEGFISDGLTPVASPAEAQPERLRMPAKTLTNAEYLADEINTWANGNGIEAKAENDSDKVVVTGKAVSDSTLELTIPKGVTVEWRADLTRTAQTGNYKSSRNCQNKGRNHHWRQQWKPRWRELRYVL